MSASRRQFMQLAAGGAATFSNLAAAVPVRTQAAPAAAPPLITLTRPDLNYAAGTSLRIARVRPHRKEGVCLKHEGPITTASGRKDIVHNYGHSGAGITLSWGCASKVCELVDHILMDTGRTANPPAVAVLGYGVIGLTVASELRRKWPSMPLTFYAKDFDVSHTTSFFAGGQFAPSQVYEEYICSGQTDVLIDYLKRSRTRLLELMMADPSGSKYGIRAVNNYSLSPDGELEFSVKWKIIPDRQCVKLSFMNKKFTGYLYKTWLMNPTIMLPQLAAELSTATRTKKTFSSRDDVLNAVQETIIVNCMGYCAGAVFKDDKVEPHRGHLVVQQNSKMLGDFLSGGCNTADGKSVVAYLFERQHDIVVGGTVFKPAPGDKEHHPDKYKKLERDYFDPADPDDVDICQSLLLANMKKIFDGSPDKCVLPPHYEPVAGTCPTPDPLPPC